MKKITASFGAAMIMWLGFTPAEADAQAVRDRQVVPVAVNLNQVLRMKIINGGNIEFVFNTIEDYRLGLSGTPGTANGAGFVAANPASGGHGNTTALSTTANVIIGDGAVNNDVLMGNAAGGTYTVGTNAVSYLNATNTTSYVNTVTTTDFPVPPGWDANGAQGTYISANNTAGGQHVAGNMYRTTFTVASSTRWMLEMGAEEAAFVGTDDPDRSLNLLNVGFSLREFGNHIFETAGSARGTNAGQQLFSALTNNASDVVGLEQFPSNSALIRDNGLTGNGDANAGDEEDNAFEIIWRCGTQELHNNTTLVGHGPQMIATSLLDQGSIDPDRYVSNVMFELSIDY